MKKIKSASTQTLLKKSIIVSLFSGALVACGGGGSSETMISSQPTISLLVGSQVSGFADGTGAAASFNKSHGIAIDASGALYATDENSTIRKITSLGVVTTLAGSANVYGSADGTGAAASFTQPFGIAVDNSGTLYVADSFNNKIRKISPTGVVTTFAGSGQMGSADGTGITATFDSPTAIAVDNSGMIYVTDGGNRTIRKITPSGVVTTLAGTAGVTGSTDGTGAAASFSSPYGIAVDNSNGIIYVTDGGNETIRKITSSGVVTTYAGAVGISGTTDGTLQSARFNFPVGITIDSNSTLYVADAGDGSIRKITSAGVVTTPIASSVTYGLAGASTPRNQSVLGGIASLGAGKIAFSAGHAIYTAKGL